MKLTDKARELAERAEHHSRDDLATATFEAQLALVYATIATIDPTAEVLEVTYSAHVEAPLNPVIEQPAQEATNQAAEQPAEVGPLSTGTAEPQPEPQAEAEQASAEKPRRHR